MKDVIQSNSGLAHRNVAKANREGGKRKSVKEGINAPSRQTIVQPKLEVTTPGDSYEREADRMADFVMRKAYSGLPTEIPSATSVLPPMISRRASSSTSGVAVGNATESGIHASRGGGQPMPEILRSQMESGFGADFSGVRLHTDNAAVQMNHNLQAKAFTYGNDIYFNRGQYSPDTTEGQHLIAHELTHVVQQSGKVGREEDADKTKDSVDQTGDEHFKELKNIVNNGKAEDLIDLLIKVARTEVGYKEKSKDEYVKNNQVLYDKEGGFGSGNYTKYQHDLDQDFALGEAYCDWFVHWVFVKAFNPVDFKDRKQEGNDFYKIRRIILKRTMYEENKMSGSVGQSMRKFNGEMMFVRELTPEEEEKERSMEKSESHPIAQKIRSSENIENKDKKLYVDMFNKMNASDLSKQGEKPKKGDIVFFMGHIGLVAEVVYDENNEIKEIKTIEGNTNGVVEGKRYQGVHEKTYTYKSKDAQKIIGYGRPDYSNLLDDLKKRDEFK